MTNKINLTTQQDRHSSIIANAGQYDQDGHKPYPFVCKNAINYVANDSATNALYLNFDAPIGSAGTIKLLAGEVISDLKISCRELYAQGIGSTVNFRAVGS